MTKLMLSLIAMAALTCSAQAQCFPNNVFDCTRDGNRRFGNAYRDDDSKPAEVAKCGYIELRAATDGGVELWQTSFSPSGKIRVASPLEFGKELMNGSISVYPQQPVRFGTIEAAIDAKTNQVIPGKYEVALHTYLLEHAPDGNTYQFPSRLSNGTQCNDAANQLLNQAIDLAKQEKQKRSWGSEVHYGGQVAN